MDLRSRPSPGDAWDADAGGVAANQAGLVERHTRHERGRHPAGKACNTAVQHGMAAVPADRQPVCTMSCRVRSPGIKYRLNGGAALHGDAVRALVAWRDAVDRVFGKARGSGSRAARLEFLEVTKDDTGPVPAQHGAAIPSGRLIRDMRVPKECQARNARARGYYGHG